MARHWRDRGLFGAGVLPCSGTGLCRLSAPGSSCADGANPDGRICFPAVGAIAGRPMAADLWTRRSCASRSTAVPQCTAPGRLELRCYALARQSGVPCQMCPLADARSRLTGGRIHQCRAGPIYWPGPFSLWQDNLGHHRCDRLMDPIFEPAFASRLLQRARIERDLASKGP